MISSSIGQGRLQVFPKWNDSWSNNKGADSIFLTPCRASLIPVCPWPPTTWVPFEGVTSRSPTSAAHTHSNRNKVETGFAATPRKQTAVVLSNRYKKPSPRGVATWLLTIRRGSGSRASPPQRTRRGATPALDHSNRNTPETGIAVTPRKQTTVVLSNRNKKPPPGGVPFWLRACPHSTVLPGTHSQTGFAVNPSRSTT
jgi:hypothetical protein